LWNDIPTMNSRKSLSQKIEDTLSALIGLPIWNAGRALNLVMFDVGDSIAVQDRQNETVQVGTYQLHIQAPWRIVGSKGIVVGSDDMYQPSSDCSAGRDFDSNKHPSLYGERMGAWLDKHRRRPCRIKSVEADEIGGVCLRMSAGYRLDVVPVRSDRKSEHWRLMGPGADSPPHFVVEGPGAYRMA
jgi:hypothetical protein